MSLSYPAGNLGDNPCRGAKFAGRENWAGRPLLLRVPAETGPTKGSIRWNSTTRPRLRRRTGVLAVAVATPALVTLAPDGAGAQVGPAENAESAPAACSSRSNDSLAELLECVTINGVRAHQAALQRIADNNGGTRESGSPGFNRSVDYVVRKLRAAGYDADVQPFDFPYFAELSPAEFEQTAPSPTTYVAGTDFVTMDHSGSGDATAPVTVVDPVLPPVGGSTSGCEASDFAGFPAGNVALIQRGTCDFSVKAANAEAAGASAAIIFNEGNAPDRVDVLQGTLGGPGIGIPVIGAASSGRRPHRPPATVRVEDRHVRRSAPRPTCIADLKGKRQRVIQVGAHLDSVHVGPGIQDNGSGSAAILEVAIQMSKLTPHHTVRFSWWGAEEGGLFGSAFDVDDLAGDVPRELNRIKAYLNFDMVGSPNFARFVYDGDQSSSPEDLSDAAGINGDRGALREASTDRGPGPSRTPPSTVRTRLPAVRPRRHPGRRPVHRGRRPQVARAGRPLRRHRGGRGVRPLLPPGLRHDPTTSAGGVPAELGRHRLLHLRAGHRTGLPGEAASSAWPPWRPLATTGTGSVNPHARSLRPTGSVGSSPPGHQLRPGWRGARV